MIAWFQDIKGYAHEYPGNLRDFKARDAEFDELHARVERLEKKACFAA